jgi:hypothetical protein
MKFLGRDTVLYLEMLALEGGKGYRHINFTKDNFAVEADWLN